MNDKPVAKPDSKPPAKPDGKPAGKGTPVGMKVPPKLLARIDAIVARQPDPKPRRGQIIKKLVWEALRARSRAQQKGGAGKPPGGRPAPKAT